MATQVTNYQCPACGGPLQFSSGTGKLECEYCGTSLTPEEVEAHYAQKDQKAAENFDKEQERQAAAQETEEEEAAKLPEAEKKQREQSKWDSSTISADWGEMKGQVSTYNCPSCGAELICEATTAATSCPYCGNPSIVPGQLTGALKPDWVIPFKLDKDAAVAALKAHYKNKLFLPRAFSNDNQIQKIQGIYVPFWLFNAKVNAECQFRASNSTSHRSGDYIVTETAHYDVRRYGNVTFERVPADASRKMPDDLMDSLEPYDYSAMTPFSPAYLPGYLADKYDVSVEENNERADRRCSTSTLEAMRADVSGYQTVTPVSNKVFIDRGKVEYALLPVWVIKTKWHGKDYLFAMNGQTGKFAGNLPVDKGKYWGWLGGIAAGMTALLTLIGAGGAIWRFFAGLIEYILS